MDGKLTAYMAATVFATLWILNLYVNRKRVIAKSTQAGLSVINSVASFVLGVLSFLFIIAALVFTIGPFFNKNIAVPLSPEHIAGVIIDWSIALLFGAVESQMRILYSMIVGEKNRPEVSYAIKGSFDGTTVPRQTPLAAAGASPKSVANIEAASMRIQVPTTLSPSANFPEIIEREIPDMWTM